MIPERPERTCTKCRASKPLDEYSIRGDGSGRPRSTCRDCDRASAAAWRSRNQERYRAAALKYFRENKEACRESQKRWAAKNVAHLQDYRRRTLLKKKYGLSIEEFEAMRERQGGRCAICDRSPPRGKRLYVDHDHASGKVRQLLCSNCNLLIGMASDDETLLWSAIRYITRHRRRGAA